VRWSVYITAITGRPIRHLVLALPRTLARCSKALGISERRKRFKRHLIRGEAVSWCDQGYAWAEQDTVSWFFLAALLFVVLPYLIFKIKARAKGSQARRNARLSAGGGSRVEPSSNRL